MSEEITNSRSEANASGMSGKQKLMLYISFAYVLICLFNDFTSGSLKELTSFTQLQVHPDSGYSIVDNRYGKFPVAVLENTETDGVRKASIAVVNPYVIHFEDAAVNLFAGETVIQKEADLAPGVNTIDVELPTLDLLDTVGIEVKPNKVSFQ
jgi:hypothetical protein